MRDTRAAARAISAASRPVRRMLSSVVLAALSFNGAGPVARPSGITMMAKKAQAVAAEPTFSEYENEVGADVETRGFFDPAGFSEKNILGRDFDVLRLAELKHGRAAMLGVTGFVVQEFYRWPNSAGLFQAENPLDALSPENAPTLGIVQILIFSAIVEIRSKAYPGRVVGDIGFDPLRLSADGIPPNYQLAEIKNGRLAMIAFAAFVVQTALTGKGIVESTFDVFGA